MSDKMRIIVWVGMVWGSLTLGLYMAPVFSHAMAKDAASIQTLEKKMVSSGTKMIQYRKGKIRSNAAATWRKATKIAKSAAHVTIRKKGWYTLCVTTKTGKRKLTQLYFYKKTYNIPINTRVKKAKGYYYLIPAANKSQAMEVQGAALKAGANVSVWNRGDAACRVWKLESAGGSKYRLKNVNSGRYLGCRGKKNNAAQANYSAKDKAQLFTLYDAGSGYTYIKCMGNGQYLHVNGNNLDFSFRQRKQAWKFEWEKTDCPVSCAMVTGATYPTNIDLGSAFPLQGAVNSRYTITVLAAAVYNRQGTLVLQKKIYPNSCFSNLKEIDAAITFGKLVSGTYTYKVAVRDVTGTDISLISRSFTVGPIISSGGKTLTYDSSLISRIGHQSTGTALEKKACASYALAYCNAILSGTTPSPHSYWSSATNVDCVWSKGGYTTKAYASEQAVLQAAAAQIEAGKPCILHVTGNTEQHWLTVIGYKKNNSSTFTASHLIAIDPWDGKVITVSDKYKVKSTYRLGIKS